MYLFEIYGASPRELLPSDRSRWIAGASKYSKSDNITGDRSVLYPCHWDSPLVAPSPILPVGGREEVDGARYDMAVSVDNLNRRRCS